MRLIALALCILATACNSSHADKPTPVERNLVCERVAILSPKATCAPELSGQGDLATHTARVTVEPGKPAIVCGLNAGQLSMACGTLEVQAQQPVEMKTDQPANPAPMKATKGKK